MRGEVGGADDGRAVDAVVFDFDGVIRHWDREHQRGIEVAHGLPEGSLLTTAFASELGRRFMSGELDHDEFGHEIGRAVGVAAAGRAFVEQPAEVDHHMVDLVRRVAQRAKVALLTNGSRRTRQELRESGLHDLFAHVGNSAETAVLKPHPGAYTAVLTALSVEAPRSIFIDDHLPNVEGAIGVGMIGHHFTERSGLHRFLEHHGVV